MKDIILYGIGAAVGAIIYKIIFMKDTHVHIHNHPDREIKESLNLIINKLNLIMTKQEKLDQAIADLNAGTNEIAADLQKLKDELAAGNVSDESLQSLSDNIEVLKQLGSQQ